VSELDIFVTKPPSRKSLSSLEIRPTCQDIHADSQYHLSRAAHYFKLAADQGHADAQTSYGNGLHGGKGISVDFKGAVPLFQTLLPIKDIMLLSSIMGLVCMMEKVFQEISTEQGIISKFSADQGLDWAQVCSGVCLHIMSNLLLIKDMRLIATIMEFKEKWSRYL
jgi:hypothetical protein